ncbi:MAG: cyclic peptide export ABC transporter [Methylococcaceae bacterium]|nr:cyclic peptide export ABC transporter [Methylococcaceae bacterium]
MMPLLTFVLKNFRHTLLIAIATGMASGLSGVALIAVINAALGGQTVSTYPLWWLFVALCLVLLVSRISSEFILMFLGQSVILDLRLKLSREILAAPLSSLQKLGPAKLLANLTEDVTTISAGFMRVPSLCVNLAIVLGCLIYLGWLSMEMLWVVLIAMVLGTWSFQGVQRRAYRRLLAAREHEDSMYGRFRDMTDGIKELKLHQSRREIFFTRCLQKTMLDCRQNHVSAMKMYVFAINWGNGLFYLVIGLILFAMPHWREISDEVARGYCLTVLYMTMPLPLLLEAMPVLSRAGIAFGKISSLGPTLGGVAPSPAARLPMRQDAPILEFSAITHSYRREGEEHHFILGPIDAAFHPGELIFLVGGNGSGKTTLALLMVGLYHPESGEIRLRGTPIGEAERESYRQHFSAVFSDFYLFESLLGFDELELDPKAREYLDRLQLDHKVQIQDGRFSTLDLSQGQRKRLALLVAYLEDRPFYVFDEWAADQDPVFKKIFYTEILPTLRNRGKTVVVITHDDQYFHWADRCLKLEDGKLAEFLPAGRLPVDHATGVRE